jgi:glycosyltransferase involved in cell wall biosynthesis
MNELISVYVPTRNRSDLFHRALASVLNQSYPDDCSDTLEFQRVQRLCDAHARVELLRNDRVRGANFSRNRAIQSAKGRYIAGIDDDDEFLPHRLETMLQAYRPDRAFVCAGSLIKGRQACVNQRPPRTICLGSSLAINCVGNQIFTERDKLLNVGGFDERLPSQQDHDMWVRLLKRYGPAVGLPEVLQIVYWDHLRPQITGSSRVVVGRLRFLAKHKKDMAPADRRFYLYATALILSRRLTFKHSFMTFYTYCYRISRKLNNVFQ